MDYLWTVDWVWVHIGRSKLMPREDDPLKILERINDNAFKVDLSYEYDVNATFNVFDLFLFDVNDDLRSNLFKERENNSIQTTPNDQEQWCI